ncbi:hypothetical protein CVT24_006685 [Panaeolus cyanescens]|uniref:FAD-binding PCMH-type domain-containing protein n=1 Tax=Panaeolus cyanescens TaxID=181874 RepID=A0A409X143_9AGAR|nr:hypothetical protein CVT24_006685 [Panaeolus cyanescens]
MRLKPTLAVLCIHIFGVSAGLLDPITDLAPHPVCLRIQQEISSKSDVYYFGHPLYLKGVSHWASSSSEISKCVVEPGTAEDVAVVLKIVGETKTPFAVKGGGHTTNAGFSSTTGVHISMYRFSDVKYDVASQTATIGAGLLWDDVYATLEPHGVNVVGGRLPGVGVAGFILGGGYSWKSNQYGLTIDTVLAYELVTPGGVIMNVTHESEPELFYALKGALNNFGVVTKFTLRTFPQTKVWGGNIYYTSSSMSAVSAATIKFHATVSDPKAAVMTMFGTWLGSEALSFTVAELFYDAPQPPPGIFDDFLNIPALTKDVKIRSFSSLVAASPTNLTSFQRGVIDTVPLLDISPSIMDAIIHETLTIGARLTLSTDTFFSFTVQPFLPTLYSHTSLPSAFPWTRSKPYLPLNLYAAWALPTVDPFIRAEVEASAQRIRDLAVRQGQEIDIDAPKYVNYAPGDTPLRMVYGPEKSIERLRDVKRVVDPGDVMGLAGGFKIRL